MERRVIGRCLIAVLALSLAGITLAGVIPVTRAAPARGGTLVVGANSECLRLDPHLTTEIACRSIVGRHVYSGLVKFNERMEIRPDLAERWDVTGDGRTITFSLRAGVQFHNGDEFTAEDVKVSLERIADPKTASPLRSSFSALAGVDAVNARTARVRLTSPDAAFLAALAGPQAAILPRSILRRDGDMNNAVVGTGPFRLVSRRKDVNTVLARNPRYFVSGVPYLDAIEFRIITDDTARSVALRTGRVQFIDRVTFELANVLERIPGLNVIGGPSLNFRAAVPNINRRPWSDVRVRQALAVGIDRREILKAALGGRGEALNGGPIPSTLWAALPEPCFPRPDIAKAKELLAQAGFPNGFSSTLLSFSEISLLADTAIALREQALALGIDLRLELLELGIVQTRVARGDFDIAIRGYAGVDPDEWISRPFHSRSPQNFNKFTDPQVDALIERGRAVQDQGQRRAVYVEVQRRLCDLSPVVWLYSGSEYFAMRPEVKGYLFRANNEHNFESVRLGE
jgi:peptide/nickel transport system substrate-binding protein